VLVVQHAYDCGQHTKMQPTPRATEHRCEKLGGSDARGQLGQSASAVPVRSPKNVVTAAAPATRKARRRDIGSATAIAILSRRESTQLTCST
jgi:hypothetical protein